MGVGTLWDKKTWKLLEGLDHHQQTDEGIKTKRRIAFSVLCIVEPAAVAWHRNFGLPHALYLGGGIGGSSSREISSDDEKTECSPRLPSTGGLD